MADARPERRDEDLVLVQSSDTREADDEGRRIFCRCARTPRRVCALLSRHTVPWRTPYLSEGVVRWHNHGHDSGITRYFDAQDGVRHPAS